MIKRGDLYLRALGTALFAASVPTTALSQEATAVDAGPGQAPGTIIVLRDVPYGTALERQSKGEALEVEVGPQRTILSALADGLKPLSSSEQASIYGSTDGAAFLPGQSAMGDLRHVETVLGTGRSVRAGETAGGKISGALSRLPSVGSIVRGAIGSGQ